MQKRVFVIHGWGGYPKEGLFPWLKKSLESKGFAVSVPAMPGSPNPKIKNWVPFLKKRVGAVDENTYFVGHSIGCQTILRYLESLPKNLNVGGVFLLAPWVHLLDAAYSDDNDRKIAKPWLKTPIKWAKAKFHCKKFIVLFSDNDSCVPLSDSKIFKSKLCARIILEHNKGHFSGDDGIKKLPSLLKEIIKVAK